MHDLNKALNNLKKMEGQWRRSPVICFNDFLQEVIDRPDHLIRNIYQVYADMIDTYVPDGIDEYGGDPASIRFLKYDFNKIFVDESDRPFYADRLFANRLMRHVESIKVGAKQNKIYIFDGPHGSGKSTFLNNLLRTFENYANSPEGQRFEVVWHLEHDPMAGGIHSFNSIGERLARILESDAFRDKAEIQEDRDPKGGTCNHFYVPCPSHDNPLLLIPKEIRRQFFDDLLDNEEFKWKLFTEKKYEWIFHEDPCTICVSIYQELLKKFRDPLKVMECVFARPYVFNRRLGEGVSIFNPGDRPPRHPVIGNQVLQRCLDGLFSGSSRVSYFHSQYAKTNSGVYALMDIKSHNTDRLMELHNIISDGVHKVEDIEETVNSLLFALMNPEDKILLTDLRAFSDRVEYINIPYVLDLQTEVDIYREKFGKHIDESFLPRVLHNFARVIIATRLRTKSEAMDEWIGDPGKYEMYCDINLQLLKMEIFTGYIPEWLGEDDVTGFTSKRRQKLIAESEKDGWKGLSGRDSIRMFNEFYATYAQDDKLIDMSMLGLFFRKFCKTDRDILPMGFLDSLLRMYNFTVLQEVKESLYYYNEDQITRDIVNYIFAVNFEPDTVEYCEFTKEKVEVTEAFFRRIEERLRIDPSSGESFRASIQKTYSTSALPQEMLRDGSEITETSLFLHLYEKSIYTLKEKVLEPFLQNENFRRAVKDYNTEEFRTYDRRIRADVTFLMRNLQKKHRYSRQGAKEICIYVIDNNLAEQFSGKKAVSS